MKGPTVVLRLPLPRIPHLSRTLKAAAVAAALLVPALAVPATAAGPTPPVKVISSTCPDGFLDAGQVDAAKGGDGKVHGFAVFKYSAKCGDKIFYFEGSGTSWKVTATPFTGRVVSVASDANGTSYLMYIFKNSSGAPQLAVARRTTAGNFGNDIENLAILNTAASQDGLGSLVAKNGLWFAVWPQYSTATGTYTLWQADTMFGGGGDPGAPFIPTPGSTKTSDTHPQLALDTEGQPRLFWERAASDGKQDLLIAPGAYSAWGNATSVAKGVAISADHPALDLAVTGTRTFTSWTRTVDGIDSAVIGTNSGGTTWSLSTPPSDPYPAGYDPHLQASASTAFAAFGVSDGPPGSALVGTKNGSAAWSVGPPLGVPGSIDTFGVAALAYNGSGHTTSLIYSGNTLYAVNR